LTIKFNNGIIVLEQKCASFFALYKLLLEVEKASVGQVMEYKRFKNKLKGEYK